MGGGSFWSIFDPALLVFLLKNNSKCCIGVECLLPPATPFLPPPGGLPEFHPPGWWWLSLSWSPLSPYLRRILCLLRSALSLGFIVCHFRPSAGRLDSNLTRRHASVRLSHGWKKGVFCESSLPLFLPKITSFKNWFVWSFILFILGNGFIQAHSITWWKTDTRRWMDSEMAQQVEGACR